MTRYFEDRLDAGRRLAAALGAYRGRNPLVLAIPRAKRHVQRVAS